MIVTCWLAVTENGGVKSRKNKPDVKANKKLDGLVIDDDGNPLSDQELRKLLKEKKAEGYEVLPMCDNHDERGYCQGHTVHE